MILVREMMNKNVISVKEDTDIKTICKILTKRKITGVPVLNKAGDIIGFVSERDIIASVTKKNFLKIKAKQIMTKKVEAVEDNTSLNEVSLIFSNKPFRHLPVTHNGKLVGIITRNDIVDQMLGHYY